MPLSLLVRTFHEACMTSLTMVLIHQQLHIMRIPRKMLLLPRLQIQEKHSSEHYQFEFIDVCVKTIMQGLNEIAENDPSIIEKTVKDLQSVSANINSYDTMIDMFIKSNSDLADNLTKLQEVLPQIKDVLTGTTDVADIANKSLDNVTDDIANQIDAQLKAMNELSDSVLDSLDKAVQLSITDVGQAGVELSKANKQLKELIDQNKALEDAIDSLSKVDGIDPAVITALKSALASVNAMEISHTT